MTYYLITLLVYFLDDAIWVLGLNIQMGMAGIVNLGNILFLALGAYLAAVVTMGPSAVAMKLGLDEKYIFGLHLPFPIPWIACVIGVGILAYLIGFVVLRRMRGSYLAIVTLSVSQIVWTVIGNNTHIFNGDTGLTQVPRPLMTLLHLPLETYNWLYIAMMIVMFALCFWFAHCYYHSPLGRATRAVRENEAGAASLGKNAFKLRMLAFVAGACMMALAGALLVEYITVWSPSAWALNESFVAICALIIGGSGNNRGAVLGAFLVPVFFLEISRFIPSVGGNTNLGDAFEFILIGVLIILFLWFRPVGILREKKARWPWTPPVKTERLQTLQHLAEGGDGR